MNDQIDLPRPDSLVGTAPSVRRLRGVTHRVEGAGLADEASRRHARADGRATVNGGGPSMPPGGLMAAPFKLLLQRGGVAQVWQGGRRTRVTEGELVLIDGAQPFVIEMPQAFDQVLVTLPRAAVGRRYRWLAQQTAVSRGPESGIGLLHDFVRALAERVPHLSKAEGLHGVGALVELLGLLHGEPAHDARAELRQRALALMALDIADANAERLAAQLRVSRRHLDSVFTDTGRSLGRQLWDLRVQLASERLAQTDTSVTALAHALGFKDSSHFSRVFRRRFGCTPSAWRGAHRSR